MAATSSLDFSRLEQLDGQEEKLSICSTVLSVFLLWFLHIFKAVDRLARTVSSFALMCE